VRIDGNGLAGLESFVRIPVPDEGGDVRNGERAAPEKLFLHLVDDFSDFVYIFFFARDCQLALAGGNSHAERLAQKTEVTIGRAEQFELLVI
jgi:hypothetical protein